MRLDANDPVVEDAIFGKEVEQFLEGPIGAYLLKCAKDEIESAVEDLKAADPFAPTLIAQIQMRIAVPERVLTWLGDAVRAGLQATEQLREEA